MAKNSLNIVVLLLIAAALLLFSCTAAKVPRARVIRANYLYNKGEDAMAAYVYLQIGREAKWNRWLQYNLGTLYLSLGEVEPAMQQLTAVLAASKAEDIPEEARSEAERQLIFRTLFNRGVAHYEKGRMNEAAAAFIQALKLNPKSWDAKVNLELSLRSSRADLGEHPEDPDRSEQAQADDSRIMSLLQKAHQQGETDWQDRFAPQNRSVQDW